MDDFFYSNDAESVLNLFHDADVMVYVEGKDDICFWEFLFSACTKLNVKIQDVGSCNDLKPYINNIVENKSKSIVAFDMDLSFFDKEMIVHRNIIRTFGYSIENTLIYPDDIMDIILNLSKVSSRELGIIKMSSWMNCFLNSIINLINLEIFNYKHNLGLSVMSDNVSKFLISKQSHELSESKIEAHMDELIKQIDVNFYNEFILAEIKNNKLDRKRLVRGHFLFSATSKYILSTVKLYNSKVTLPNDSFYAMLMLSFKCKFNDQHPEYEYYNRALNEIAA